MAGTEALRRRVERLTMREHAALIAFGKTLTRDEQLQVLALLRELGRLPATLPPGNPWELPPEERRAYADELQRHFAGRTRDPAVDAAVDQALARLLRELQGKRMAQNGAQWRT